MYNLIINISFDAVTMTVMILIQYQVHSGVSIESCNNLMIQSHSGSIHRAVPYVNYSTAVLSLHRPTESHQRDTMCTVSWSVESSPQLPVVQPNR